MKGLDGPEDQGLRALLDRERPELALPVEVSREEEGLLLEGLLRAEGGRVTGDHDFRIGTCLRFHAPDVEYVRKDALPRGGVEWLIVHRVDGDPRPAPADEESDSAGNVYGFASLYPSSGGPADWGWFLYRNKDRPPR